MKSKELLLWVVAIGALVLSLITVIGPKGLSSNAARSNLALTQSEILFQEREYGPDDGTPCIFWTRNSDGTYTQHSGTTKRIYNSSDQQIGSKCVGGGYSGSNYIVVNDN